MDPHKAGKILAEAGEDKAFYIYSGTKVRNLRELATELEVMTDEAFRHHTTGRNDFSAWIKGVFKDATLASDIEGASRIKMAAIIKKRLKEAETVKEIDKHSSREILMRGVVDFAIGFVVGVILGIIIRSLF
jgi:hypothetical protein